MNAEDTARCQQAIALANAGMKDAAYLHFYELYSRGNAEDVTLLYWLAYTTPSLVEAQRAIATIYRIAPHHPTLPDLRRYVSRKSQREMHYGSLGPVLECHHCHYNGPAQTKSKVAVGGWIWLSAFFLLFLGCWVVIQILSSTPVPDYLLPQMEQNIQNITSLSWFFLLLSFIGFAIRKKYYICSACGIALGNTAY
jgi:hypothetical protein